MLKICTTFSKIRTADALSAQYALCGRTNTIYRPPVHASCPVCLCPCKENHRSKCRGPEPPAWQRRRAPERTANRRRNALQHAVEPAFAVHHRLQRQQTTHATNPTEQVQTSQHPAFTNKPQLNTASHLLNAKETLQQCAPFSCTVSILLYIAGWVAAFTFFCETN